LLGHSFASSPRVSNRDAESQSKRSSGADAAKGVIETDNQVRRIVEGSSPVNRSEPLYPRLSQLPDRRTPPRIRILQSFDTNVFMSQILNHHRAAIAPVPTPVSDNQLLASLPLEERHRLAPYLEPVLLKSRQVLVEFDSPIEYVYFLDGAVTSTVVHTPDGETIEVGIVGAEGFVGLSLLYGSEHSNATVVVQIPGRALRMRSYDFMRHVTRSASPTRDLLLRYANFFQVMVQQHAACNVAHAVEQRLCRWILLTHDRAGSDIFALTHEYLAVMLGVRRATVTTIARRLKDQGVVAYTRGRLAVTNRSWLENCSCECYGLIKEQMARTFNEQLPQPR